MVYHFKFIPYSRPFKSPLRTHHGLWKVRQGLIIYLSHESGKEGWGEIAPLSWFGSETLQEATEFCQQLPNQITTDTIFHIPEQLPACQFGFESALVDIQNQIKPIQSLQFCGLLPTGKTALTRWHSLFTQGYRTFKWKIGVASLAEEIEILQQLIEDISQILTGSKPSILLRLDANGGLTKEAAKKWLKYCDDIVQNNPIKIEWIEQPLPVNAFEVMLELSHHYQTPIALDESVATLQNLETCYQQGWRGIVVIKPAIIGSPQKLRQFCQKHPINAVFSSVFETEIGRAAALNLAGELSDPNYALGFGVQHLFKENE